MGAYRLSSGAIINVTMKGNRLILDPVGQSAVSLLTNFQASKRQDLEILNSKTEKILDDAVKGDFTMLKTEIAPEKFEGFKAFLSELFELSEGKKLPSVNYTIIGSHPL